MNLDKEIKKISYPKLTVKGTILHGCLIIAKNLSKSVVPNNAIIPEPMLVSLNIALNTSLDVLLAAYSSEENGRKLKLLIKQINNNFEIMNKKVNIQSDNLDVIWKKVLRGTIEATGKEKIKLFANALTSFLINNFPFQRKLSVLSDIDSLEIEHIQLLKLAHESKNNNSTNLQIKEASNKINIVYSDCFKLANDLLSKGLIVDPMVGTYDYGGFKTIKVSDYGERFIDYIKNYEN